MTQHPAFELTVDDQFSAAHCLRNYDGSCARLHGHTWHVSVTVGADSVGEMGMCMDFKEIADHLSRVVDLFDHRQLNDVAPFDEINPTAENIARVIFEKISRGINREGVRVVAVRVAESDRYRVTYRGGVE